MVVKDELFSTLDPVTRHLALPRGQRVLLTDTVGFIHKLPTLLVASFRATLEELGEADLILHVVDITHRNAAHQCQTVEGVLKKLSLEDKPRVTVFNKLDLALGSEEELQCLTTVPFLEGEIMAADKVDENVALISATKSWGIDKLLEKIACRLDNVSMQTISAKIE